MTGTGRRAAHRRALLAVAVASVLVTGTACGSGPDLLPRTTTGTTGRATVVLMDTDARPAVMEAVADFVTARDAKVVSAQGTPAAILASVEEGAVVDAVVLPAGPALDRVRDELITPPSPIGRSTGITWYIAAITARGLPYARYLVSAQGRAALARHGIVG